MKIHTLCLDTFVYPEGTPFAGRRREVLGSIVETATGSFLFDTGLSEGGTPEQNARFQRVAVDLLAELRSRGIRPTDVVGIANSHLHGDHCGRNRLFPSVPIFVQRTELDAARVRGYTSPDSIDFPGARYEVIDGETEPHPGVHLVPTPGHTAGHQSALVMADEGLVALAGHAEGIEAKLRALGAVRIVGSHDW